MTAIPHMRFDRARPIQALSGRVMHISLVLVLILTQLVFVSGTVSAVHADPPIAGHTGEATETAVVIETIDFIDLETDEVQSVWNDSTGGTFTLTFGDETTAALAWNASAGDVETALNALPGIEACDTPGQAWCGSVTVTGSGIFGDEWMVTFDRGVAMMTATDSLTGGSTTIDEVTPGLSAPIDPAGIVYLGDNLLISDSEINEEPSVFDEVNLWEMTTLGVIIETGVEAPSSMDREPTGLGYNAANNHVYISNDISGGLVSDVDPGGDGLYGTGDDSVTTLPTGPLGVGDSEDVAWDPVSQQIFIISGTGTTGQNLIPMVRAVGPGPDGLFDGVNDVTGVIFDISSLAGDGEGIEYRQVSDTLLIIDPTGVEHIYEITKDGRLIRTIDIGVTVNPSDVAIAPASGPSMVDHLYVVDRVRDNTFEYPPRRDGKMYEFSVAFANLAPWVEAGGDQVVGFGAPAVLIGDSYDDGQGSGYTSPPFIPSFSWSKVSGPGAVTFDDASALSTDANFSTDGVYVLKLEATDGDLMSADTIEITVFDSAGVNRIWGPNRYATAAAVADEVFLAPSVAYISIGTNFPDALVAGSRGDGPVLLTTTNALPAETVTALTGMAPLSEIFVVGGTAVISPAVEAALGAYAPTVTRIAGADRYATAAEFSNAMFPSASTVFIAFGGNFPDALVASAAAGSLNAPVLLVTTDSIPAATVAELTRLSPTSIFIVGGTAVISSDVETALGGFGATTRLAGPNRYATAAAVSSALFTSAADVWIATGLNFPDALVAAGGAINSGGPVLLVQTDSIPADTDTELGRIPRGAITIVGGTAVVSAGVEVELGMYIP